MATLQGINIPLSMANRQLALTLGQTQKDPERAKQLRLNVLSVCAVEQYLSYLDISTSRELSDSFDAINHSLYEPSDLMLSDIGRIECCSVREDQDYMFVPKTVWQDRIGYFAIQLNEELTEGRILGFMKTVNQTQVPLSTLKDLDDLIDYLDNVESLLINLRNWIKRSLQSGWELISETIDEMTPKPEMVGQLAFRSQSKPFTGSKVTCQKHICQIPFLISLSPRTELDYDYDIEVRLNLEQISTCSDNTIEVNNQSQELQVLLLSETGEPLGEKRLSVSNSSSYTALTFNLNGDRGDHFIIQVNYQGQVMTEIVSL